MVTVWVNLLHSCSFSVLVCLYNVVDLLLLPPVHEILEHNLHGLQVKLPGTTKSQQVMVVEVKFLQVVLHRTDPFLELHDGLVHFGASIAHESCLGNLLGG